MLKIVANYDKIYGKTVIKEDTSMALEERANRILWKVQHEGRVHTGRLAEEYGVSEETVRRDIRQLAKEGKLKRVRGGAVCMYPPSSENAYFVRRLKDVDAKCKIGTYAAGLIQDGDIVALDGSCCTEQLAHALFARKNVVFVTNFIPVAGLLGEKIQQKRIQGRVILLGGEVNCENLVACGAIAEEAVAKFCFTWAFISASALSDTGAMIWNIDEGNVSNVMAEHATHVVLLCESAKFSQTSLYQYMDYGVIDMLITDDEHEIPEKTRENLENNGVEVVILKVKEDIP